MAFALNEDKGSKTDAEKLSDLQRNCREGSLKYMEDFYCQDHLASQYFQMFLPGHPKGYTLLHEAVEVRDRITCGHVCRTQAHKLSPTRAHPRAQCGRLLADPDQEQMPCTAVVRTHDMKNSAGEMHR